MTEDVAAPAVAPEATVCTDPKGHNAIAVFRCRLKDGFRKTHWTICIYCEHHSPKLVGDLLQPHRFRFSISLTQAEGAT